MQKIKPLESIFGLNTTIQKAIQSIPKSDRYFIALSGGLDSIALLYFCLPHLKLYTNHIHAIHINHGLSPNANAWAEFCLNTCQHLGVICHVENVSVVVQGEGVEAQARKARYEVFDRYLQEGGLLLQGHHLNDQAETVLMRVFKGLGPEAIKGIPQQRSLSSGSLYRPWLNIPRALLVLSVEKACLTWVEDESNQDTRFDRNYIRQDVLPMLSARRPSIINDLARVARKSQESYEFIQEWCQENKYKFLSECYSQYHAIDLTQISKFSTVKQRFIIRFWLDMHDVAHPSESSFQRIFDELLVAKIDSKAEVCCSTYVLRVYNGTLFCLPRSLVKNVECEGNTSVNILLSELKDGGNFALPVGKLTLTLLKDSEINLSEQAKCKKSNANIYEVICRVPDSIEVLTIKYREGGEKIYLHQDHSASLKKLYQSNKILPWLRDKLPLIYSKDELLCSLAGFTAYLCQLDADVSANIATRLIRFRYEMS